MTPHTCRALVRLIAVALIAVALILLATHPAVADYSDQGAPHVSLVPPVHVDRTAPPGQLERTGIDTDDILRLAVLLTAGGTALVLIARKREQAR